MTPQRPFNQPVMAVGLEQPSERRESAAPRAHLERVLGSNLLRDPDWHMEAACAGARDPDIFFPERGQSPKEARAYCERCPVKRECFIQGVQMEEFGIWGGTSPKQRQKLRRATQAA